MTRPNAAYAVKEDDQSSAAEPQPDPVMLGLGMYVNDACHAITRASEHASALSVAHAEQTLDRMQESCDELAKMAQRAHTLATVLGHRIAMHRRREPRCRT